MTEDSCLVKRLENYIRLTTIEREFIAELEKDEEHAKRGFCVIDVDETSDRIAILNEGWASVSAYTNNGNEQIVRLYIPGEIIGLSELGLKTSVHRVELLTDGKLCPFPRKSVTELFDSFPRLAALLTSLSCLETISLRSYAMTLGAMPASDRIRYFILELLARLSITNSVQHDAIQIPLSQEKLGLATGLTTSYVNRLLQKWKDLGDLEIQGQTYKILARERWETEIGFVNLYDDIDQSWFPTAAQ